MAWGKAGSTTLSSAGDTITFSSLSDNRCYMVLYHDIAQGDTDPVIRFNNDNGSNYANRINIDGTNENTQINTVQGAFGAPLAESFQVGYIVNIASEEKLFISSSMNLNSAGAGNAPARRETVGKWANTSDAINRMDLVNISSGSFNTDSNLTALGSDITPASAIPFPTNVQAGSRAEITDTRKMYSFESALEFDDDFSSNSGWTYVGTVSYNSSGYQNLTFTRNGNNNGCYYNLGTVSDTSWMLRAKLHLTTKSTSSQSSFIGLTSITGGSNSAQDAIGMFFITVNNTLFSVDSDGQTIAAGANSSNSFTTTNGNDYWIQITRLTATTMRVEIFDNANYTGTASITINDTIPSSIQSTNYLKLQNREELSNNGSSDNWTCDDVKFYNGVTSVSNTWKEIGA